MIASWFVQDLQESRADAKANHIIQAIGSSSIHKGKSFLATNCPDSSAIVHGSYAELYTDPNVDCIYVATPHAFHKKNCLDAIAAKKHVLCEKPFTITAKESLEVFAAAKANGVFIMEGLWLRFNPVMLSIRQKLHRDKVIGDVTRVFCDFGLGMDLSKQGPESRMKDPALGAGSLLDSGIYSLTWGILCLDSEIGEEAQQPSIKAVQTLSDGVDIASSTILHYPSGQQGIITSTTENKTDPTFCRIEGTQGYIIVEGIAASAPTSFTVYPRTTVIKTDDGKIQFKRFPGETYTFEKKGKGLYWEADEVALDIAAGRMENARIPHAETIRVMKILDEIRNQGGARFPQDSE